MLKNIENESICEISLQMLNFEVKKYIGFNFDTQCQLDLYIIFVQMFHLRASFNWQGPTYFLFVEMYLLALSIPQSLSSE